MIEAWALSTSSALNISMFKSATRSPSAKAVSVIYDVVIAGAGPVGLFLACELRMANLSVLILEGAETATSALKALPFGVRGMSAPTTEALYRRGLLEEAVLPAPAASVSGERRQGGHFAGIPIPLDKVDATGWASRLPSPAAANMPTTMERLKPFSPREPKVSE